MIRILAFGTSLSEPVVHHFLPKTRYVTKMLGTDEVETIQGFGYYLLEVGCSPIACVRVKHVVESHRHNTSSPMGNSSTLIAHFLFESMSDSRYGSIELRLLCPRTEDIVGFGMSAPKRLMAT